ncbi:Mu transposase C-terminal domain-containing protein [Pikeienuella sp. HZG-20]|uniref:Mu transposase C-terminal domain-containing protein n=1 Tax=Paludibacillus litoralis TaxID=3133267 RepID=UPI0030EBAA5F
MGARTGAGPGPTLPSWRSHADEARKKFAPVGRGLQVTRPLERVEMDEWTIDLQALMAQTGILDHLTEEEKDKLGLNRKKIRWSVTVAICAATRCIVAMRLSHAPSANSAMQAIEMITQDKGVWGDLFGAISPWNMCGVPELIVTDCGSAFVSFETRAAMQDLGIRAERAPAGLPEMRARIERLFRTISVGLLPLLTGRTFSDVVSKGDSDPEARAALTPEDLSEALVRWIVDVYHNRPHEGLNGETPANCWSRLVDIYGVQPAPDMRRRRLVFGIRTIRTLGKKGLRVFGVYYHSDALAGWMLRNTERDLALRWHREDIGAIEVFLDGEWVEVPAVVGELKEVRAEVWYGAVKLLRASFRREAEFSRPIVLQAIRDIEARNGEAMRRQGLVVQDWSEANLQRMEERLMIGFDMSAADSIDEIGPRAGWGTEYATGGQAACPASESAAADGEIDITARGREAARTGWASISGPHEPDDDEDDAWTNETK